MFERREGRAGKTADVDRGQLRALAAVRTCKPCEKFFLTSVLWFVAKLVSKFKLRGLLGAIIPTPLRSDHWFALHRHETTATLLGARRSSTDESATSRRSGCVCGHFARVIPETTSDWNTLVSHEGRACVRAKRGSIEVARLHGVEGREQGAGWANHGQRRSVYKGEVGGARGDCADADELAVVIGGQERGGGGGGSGYENDQHR